jgi:hypothetical protein
MLLLTGLPKTTGNGYLYLTRSTDGYWLTAAGLAGSGDPSTWWSATKPTGATLPASGYKSNGDWRAVVAAATITALASGVRLTASMADNETEASCLAASGSWEDTIGAPQTGDAYARLGTPAGASVSADIAAIPAAVEANDGSVWHD